MKPLIPVYDISTISEFKQEDFLVSKFAPYQETHQNLHYPHRHSFYHILLFTKGGGTHTIDFQTFPVKPFQIYFMIPGQVHSWSFEGDVDGYVVNFSIAFFQSFLLRQNFLEEFSFFAGNVNSSVIDIPKRSQPTIQRLFEEILKEATESQQFSAELVRVLLIKIFIAIVRLTGKGKEQINANYNYTLLKNFQQLIEKHYLTMRLPKDYADMLSITPHHLNALCNDLLGISTGEVIRNRVVLEAKRLLINLNLSISEVAYQLNFNDNSYFSKFFKKHVGLTPEEFRKKALTK